MSALLKPGMRLSHSLQAELSKQRTLVSCFALHIISSPEYVATFVVSLTVYFITNGLTFLFLDAPGAIIQLCDSPMVFREFSPRKE